MPEKQSLKKPLAKYMTLYPEKFKAKAMPQSKPVETEQTVVWKLKPSEQNRNIVNN